MDLTDILKQFTIEEIKYYEEKYDKQYLALKKLYEDIKDKNLFLKLILINSLLSFQLKMKGEEYWTIFSDFFSKNNKDICKSFIEFLEKYNSRFLHIKIRRLEKICKWILDKDLIYYSDKILELNRTLANIMNQKEDDKTIVFSTKMYIYGIRIIGYNIDYPKEIFIPIDNRIGKISQDKKFWIKLSENTNLPLLAIDSLIWITLGININNIEENNLREKIKKLKEYLNNVSSNQNSIRY